MIRGENWSPNSSSTIINAVQEELLVYMQTHETAKRVINAALLLRHIFPKVIHEFIAFAHPPFPQSHLSQLPHSLLLQASAFLWSLWAKLFHKLQHVQGFSLAEGFRSYLTYTVLRNAVPAFRRRCQLCTRWRSRNQGRRRSRSRQRGLCTGAFMLKMASWTCPPDWNLPGNSSGTLSISPPAVNSPTFFSKIGQHYLVFYGFWFFENIGNEKMSSTNYLKWSHFVQ